MKKIVIAHPDRQHSLQLALALQENNILFKYITTVYLKKWSLSSFIANLSPKKIKNKFLKHKLDALNDANIEMFCEFKMLLLSFVGLFIPNYLFYKIRKKIRKSFNSKVARYCIENDVDILISYDVLSSDDFSILKQFNIKLILDVSAPCFFTMYKEFEKSNKQCYSSSIDAFLRSMESIDKMEATNNEIKLFDYFIVASNYSRMTLISAGVLDEKILLIPYGINQKEIDTSPSLKSQFSCIYVGSITRQKGCHIIFKIAEKLPEISFKLIGQYDNSYTSIPANCHLYGYLTYPEIEIELKKSHVFLFLSLCDGFGLAALEAMANGLPVICSTNAGIKDVINGNGYIVDPYNEDAIIDYIVNLKNNISLLEEMRQKSILISSLYTWDKYAASWAHFLETI